MAHLRCFECNIIDNTGSPTCPQCGGRLTPIMRVVIMPFVESGMEVSIEPEYRGLVEHQGELPLQHCIGCQTYITSETGALKLVSTQREQFFTLTGKMLPVLVKRQLDKLGFYEVPDVKSVDAIAEEAGDMPTELFVLIQNQLDPDFLFLPEINCFFFRYPDLDGRDEMTSSGFAFVKLSAFLLDNRENKIMSRGSGSGLAGFELPPGTSVTSDLDIDNNQQVQTLFNASETAVANLLIDMKMV